MPSFSFDIEDVFDLGGGFKGITLIGPPVETEEHPAGAAGPDWTQHCCGLPIK
jgi:hypothetical protein